jgi:hypothetical protein
LEEKLQCRMAEEAKSTFIILPIHASHPKHPAGKKISNTY